MYELQDVQKQLLKKYCRAIVHMRQQLHMRRFSLIFGAGLSKSFGLPDWPTLVNEIMADPNVQGEEILKGFSGRGSLPYKTELLFQHYRKRQDSLEGHEKLGSREFENRTSASWLKICAAHLYSNAPINFKDALKKHAYLVKYLPIIQETPITITYNFDDFLERALLEKKKPDDISLGYETVTNPWTQFRRKEAVIYHPHGVWPTELMEIPRDRIVLSESSYARLFLSALAGDQSFLLNHLSKNTCCIIGMSLEDEDLRNLLIQSAQSNSGNPHYYIYFKKPDEKISSSKTEAIQQANFHVYNLITLFLNENEIAALADLLYCGALGDDGFCDLVEESDECPKYCFYLTGSLGVGKSTIAGQLRSFTVLDEWAEPRPPILAKPWKTLNDEERKKADEWITRQFKIKNNRLRHEKFGIFIIDRPPMDPLAFTPSDKKSDKATLLLNVISSNHRWPIENGTVILLEGDPKELAARNLATGREGYIVAELEQMENDLKVIYQGEGVKIINTRGRSIAEVTHVLLETILFEDYKVYNFTEKLTAEKEKKPYGEG